MIDQLLCCTTSKHTNCTKGSATIDFLVKCFAGRAWFCHQKHGQKVHEQLSVGVLMNEID